MKRYSRYDGGPNVRRPAAFGKDTTIYISSGVHYEGGVQRTNLQGVHIQLVGPPEEIDRIMERFGLEPTDE